MKLIFIHGAGGSPQSYYYQTRHFEGSEAVALPGHPEGTPVRPSPPTPNGSEATSGARATRM